MKNFTKAWMLFIVVQAFAVSPGLAQFAKTSSFYSDRCNTGSDEIMVTVNDTGGEAVTVTIKVTNLVTSASTSYPVNRDTDVRPNCDWLASSEGPKSLETVAILSPKLPQQRLASMTLSAPIG